MRRLPDAMSVECQIGSCFLIPSGPTGEHVFTVALGPKVLAGHGPLEQVILLSFTTIRQGLPHDPACVIRPDEHPFIKHDSYVYYREPRVYSVLDVQKKFDVAN